MELSKNTELLISKDRRQIFLRLLSQLNTIQTEHVISLLIAYADGEKTYILAAPLGLKVGDVVISSDSADIKVGNSKLLKDIPVGT